MSHRIQFCNVCQMYTFDTVTRECANPECQRTAKPSAKTDLCQILAALEGLRIERDALKRRVAQLEAEREKQ